LSFGKQHCPTWNRYDGNSVPTCRVTESSGRFEPTCPSTHFASLFAAAIVLNLNKSVRLFGALDFECRALCYRNDTAICFATICVQSSETW
jgi:hypothetical protein